MRMIRVRFKKGRAVKNMQRATYHIWIKHGRIITPHFYPLLEKSFNSVLAFKQVAKLAVKFLLDSPL